MKKMLVTGGAGFIGSHIVDRLLEEGNKVVAYDNLSTGRMDNIKHHRDNSDFTFLKLDLLDTDALNKAVSGCTAVFHIAAHADVRRGAEDTHIDLNNGIIATHNVLEAMRLNNVPEIVFASSAAVYGETPPIPMSEDHGPLLPISLYGAAKLAAEGLISAYCRTFGMKGWMFRFANVVGGRRRQGVVYDFIRKLKENPAELEILGDGKQCKPYIHGNECADGIIYGYRHGKKIIDIFNIGVDSATDVNVIADMVVREMGIKNVKYLYTGGDRGWNGDAPQLRFDMSKMKKLGWEAKLSSDEAVIKTAIEYLEGWN